MIEWILNKTGIRERITKEVKLNVAKQISENKAWLYGINGDKIRKHNPDLSKALDIISADLIFSAHLNPRVFRSNLLERIESRLTPKGDNDG